MDALGVAIGVPGLFTSCLECFRLVQTARSLEGDFNLLVRKYTNLELRFGAWGKACGFTDGDGNNNPVVIPDYLLPHIKENLDYIKDLFGDASRLKGQYGLKSAHQDLLTEDNRLSDRLSFNRLLYRLRREHPRGASLITSTRWAIGDKEKFEKLIIDLKDLIEALEGLTKELKAGVSRNQRIHVQYEIEEIEDISSLQEIAGARAGEDDVVSDAATERLSTLGSSRGMGTTIASYYTARAWAEPDLPPVDESQVSLQSDVPQNRRLMSAFIQPKTETFDASKKTSFLDEATIIYNYSKILNASKKFVPEGLHRFFLRRLRFTTPFHNPIGDRLFTMAPINDNLNDFLVTFIGPPDTPYEEGVFFVRMELPSDFPSMPPKCRFLNKIYHPNVDPSGKICLDVLDVNWSPALDLEGSILSLISILSDPGLEDPLVPEIAVLYMSDRAQYSKYAETCTREHASPKFAPVFSADGSYKIREQAEYSHDQQRLAHLLCQNLSISYKLCPFNDQWCVFRDKKKRSGVDIWAAFEGAIINLDFVLYELCDLYKRWDFQGIIQHLENTVEATTPLIEAGFSMKKSEDAQMRELVDSCQPKLEKETVALQSLVDKV